MAKTHLMTVILAAGKGTRMVSDLPKVCHALGGRPMLAYVLDVARKLESVKIVTVIGPDMPVVESIVDEFSKTHDLKIETVIQKTQQGTGHALMTAQDHLKGFEGNVLVLFGDTPLITHSTLEKLVSFKNAASETTIILMGIRPEDPLCYGRISLKPGGDVEAIIEHADATTEQLQNPLCNSGVMLIDGKALLGLLAKLTCNNANKEYYLTDLVSIANLQGLRVEFVEAQADELAGINTRQDLAAAEKILQNHWRQQAMAKGATLIDPETVFFSYDTQLGRDVKIEPNVIFGPGVCVRNQVTIRAFCRIEGALIEDNAIVGPFAHLRPETHIGQKVRIGNFVEVKKSKIREGAKVNHLSYIGDCDMGARTNIGAGTITCNYDGFQKFQTVIGEQVSIGANTSLIAPVEIGNKAVIGAGSVVTRKVSPDSLAYSRAPQQELIGGGARYRRKHSKLKIIPKKV
ncbi:MAG: bifunctional UDP-N-acetylglucosamine diphosphorylase/glucosamine-1-phosphate N-acetyltransferase GlmU [Alphaproteobacteria bacterium]|nr:bifunctional UDP-N-acetylglucosamine diphosphorylase/glucosamine-1-phosphate N-acetyltransferase GlmU [Alphaproteobacteria bacterium]